MESTQLFHSNLWEDLNKARQKIHMKARKNSFLASLPEAGFCQTAYLKYMVNIKPLHQALEKEQQETILKIPHLKNFVDKRLFRTEAIEEDEKIWIFLGEKKIVPHPKAIEFANYIHQMGKDDPERIIAIMYCIYGSLMSGGQQNKIGVAKKLEVVKEYTDNVPEGSGVALFTIAEKIDVIKEEWHKKICEIETNLPKDRDIGVFRKKLTDEVPRIFEKFLEIIEVGVEADDC